MMEVSPNGSGAAAKCNICKSDAHLFVLSVILVLSDQCRQWHNTGNRCREILI